MAIFTSEMSDEQIVDGITRIRKDGFRSEEVAATVAHDFARSGDTYVPSQDLIAGDVASTGGPTSLSTLLAPLFLRAAGLQVPKLGVPGRPAGGIDSLAQIAGYQTSLAKADIDHALAHAGYAHFDAGANYAPLDARVFRLRQEVGAQQVPALVVASLLSKKLSVGIKLAGLDVRVSPHGNFGESWEIATLNSRLYSTVAERLNIHPQPVLTDGRFPYQPYIGRRESLSALSLIFADESGAWLSEHLEQIRQMTTNVVPANRRSSVAKASLKSLRELFFLNLEAQGASESEYTTLVRDTLRSHSTEILAEHDGFVSYNLRAIRDQFTAMQKAQTSELSQYPDPVGLILRKRPGSWVEQGQVIATLRAEEGIPIESAITSLSPFVRATASHPVSSTMEGVS